MAKTALVFMAIVFMIAPGLYSQQEEITLTTYYPSPYGSYGELHTNSFAVGSTYQSVTPPANSIIVQGSVRVGDDTSLCNATSGNQGAVRYHNNRLEFCSPGGWVNALGFQSYDSGWFQVKCLIGGTSLTYTMGDTINGTDTPDYDLGAPKTITVFVKHLLTDTIAYVSTPSESASDPFGIMGKYNETTQKVEIIVGNRSVMPWDVFGSPSNRCPGYARVVTTN